MNKEGEPKELKDKNSDVENDNGLDTETPQSENLEYLEYIDALAKRLAFFYEKYGQEVRTLYYPCCSVDYTPSEVLPEVEVLYVDNDQSVAERKLQKDRQLHLADSTKYVPDSPPDAVLLYNPTIDPGFPAKTVRSGGYVICNDYHFSASKLRAESEFELLCVLVSGDKGEVVQDADNLDNYFLKVETDEEWQKSGKMIGLAAYEDVKEVLSKKLGVDFILGLIGGDKSVLEEYKVILQENEQDISEGADMVLVDLPDRKIECIFTRVPAKKQVTEEDLFIFRRIAS